jgi:hypothetical protein
MISYKTFLNKDFNNPLRNLKVTKVKKTNYGFIIHLMTNHVCLYYKYVTLGENGSAKILTKVNKNYHSPYQNTTYENKEGTEITGKQYKELQKI